ncbi:MAG: nucleoside-diphosphate kinase [Bacteroidales bacterium]|nr:nucleoside-diphosphate kinase [Bacteroidales bacterium]MBD5284422.1 nucleoside-diphosphate kinase [Bacteroides sp.]
MEQTLVLLKPSAVERALIGEVIKRIENRGLIICGLKMMQLDEKILREHYSHLVDKPFFPSIVKSMTASPVVAMVLKGVDVVEVFRTMTGVTNGRKAAPGTLRGDFCMSGQANIVHASDSVENAKIEIARFFRPEEVFDYTPATIDYIYGEDELSN